VVEKVTQEAEPSREAEPPAPEPEPATEPPAADTSPEPPKEETPETPPEAPTVDQLDQQILEKRVEAAEALAKHWETVAGRHGGELGFIKQKLAQLEARQTGAHAPAPPVSEPDEFEPAAEPPTPTAPPPTDGVVSNKVASWAIAQAIGNGAQQFFSAHPDALQTEGFRSEMETYMQQQGDQTRLLFTDDPVAAQRGAMDLLSEAYHHVAAVRRSSAIEELQRQRADQISNMDQAKAQATISSSGSPAPQPPGPKALEDMTEDELDAVLQELGEDESDRRASGKR
jgi:hypothetical protein